MSYQYVAGTASVLAKAREIREKFDTSESPFLRSAFVMLDTAYKEGKTERSANTASLFCTAISVALFEKVLGI